MWNIISPWDIKTPGDLPPKATDIGHTMLDKDLGTLRKILRNDKVFPREKLSFHFPGPLPPNTKLRHCGIVVCKKINIVLGVGRGEVKTNTICVVKV